MLSVIEIGEKIAVARKMKNLSQAQLADLLAVSAQAVGKWERSESMPDIVTFGKLAEVLGVDLNYFGEAGLPVFPREAAPQTEAEANARFGWNMSRGNWTDADFSGLHGLAEKFSMANIERCKFVGSELSSLTVKGNNVLHSDFSNSDLKNCRFLGANFKHDVFTGCDVSESEFVRSNMQNCDFSGANLTNVVSKWSHWSKTKLFGALLRGTAFRGTQLSDIIFDNEITECSFENCDFTRTEFHGAVIRNTFFKNCKLKRVKFVNCKADKLSYAFMKTCKADLTNVEIVE